MVLNAVEFQTKFPDLWLTEVHGRS